MGRVFRIVVAATAAALFAGEGDADCVVCRAVGNQYVCTTVSDGRTPPPPLYVHSLRPASVSADAGRAFPFAGLYSADHQVLVEGARLPVEAYVEIDAAGRIEAYALRDITRPVEQGGCFVPAAGDAVDAMLQGRTLWPAVAPNGQPDYEATVGAVTFGLLPGYATDQMAWFVHNGMRNNTVYIRGARNLVNVGGGALSITGPALPQAARERLQRHMCGR